MSNNEFNREVSIDFAPHASQCEWCGKPAIQQLTAIGGPYHNDGGFFCLNCGQAFSRIVMEADASMAASLIEKWKQRYAGSADLHSSEQSHPDSYTN